jgi:hypothetical protein
MIVGSFLIPVLGMSLALGLFVLASIPFLGVRNWWQILLVAVLVAVGVPVLFQYILLVPLPVGPLGF